MQSMSEYGWSHTMQSMSEYGWSHTMQSMSEYGFFLTHIFAYSNIFYVVLLNNSLCEFEEGY